MRWLTPALAVLSGLALGAILILSVGSHPLIAYRALFLGAFGNLNNLAETVAKTTPLLLIGLGVALALKASLWNIGAEGQFYAGALAATWVGVSLPGWPPLILLPLAMLAAFVAGGLWGGIPGTLRARYGVSEIIVTIMLNYVAIFAVSYVIHGPLRDPEGYLPQSPPLEPGAHLPILLPATRLHAGILMSLAGTALAYLILKKTTLGYRLIAVGGNPVAARFAGIEVGRTFALALALSGGLAGLAGMTEVTGIHHRLMDGISPGYGFTGIVVALLGKLNPIGITIASLLFAGLIVGADAMQREANLPVALVFIIQGLVVLFFLTAEFLGERK